MTTTLPISYLVTINGVPRDGFHVVSDVCLGMLRLACGRTVEISPIGEKIFHQTPPHLLRLIAFVIACTVLLPFTLLGLVFCAVSSSRKILNESKKSETVDINIYKADMEQLGHQLLAAKGNHSEFGKLVHVCVALSLEEGFIGHGKVADDILRCIATEVDVVWMLKGNLEAVSLIDLCYRYHFSLYTRHPGQSRETIKALIIKKYQELSSMPLSEVDLPLLFKILWPRWVLDTPLDKRILQEWIQKMEMEEKPELWVVWIREVVRLPLLVRTEILGLMSTLITQYGVAFTSEQKEKIQSFKTVIGV